MADADKGLVFDAGTITVGQYLNNWLTGIMGTVRQRTWERYEQFVRVHLVPAFGGIKLGNLTRAHLKTLYASKTELSPTTIRHLHAALHKALDEAVADNLIPRNGYQHQVAEDAEKGNPPADPGSSEGISRGRT